MPKWEILRDSIILLDGYTGFTPVQYRLVELFLMHAREVVCTVTIDPRENAYKESSIQHLFYMGQSYGVPAWIAWQSRHGIAEEGGCNLQPQRPAWRFDESPEPGFSGTEPVPVLRVELVRTGTRRPCGDTRSTQPCAGRLPTCAAG
ncbi:MAG: hypothetical protein ACLTW9_12370 [Enterocloster sp.]